MAVTQTTADKAGWTLIAQKDVGGFYYSTLGSIRVYTGSGAPTHVAPIGSWCIDKVAPTIYVNTDGSTTWATWGSQS